MAETLTYTLRRIVFGDTFTGGELINPNNKRIAYTIEDTDRGLNVGTSGSIVSQTKSRHPKMTAINAGVWTINFRKNTSISSINYIDGGMGRGVVPVLDGNGWGGIRFHGGGSSRASAGCIILGTQLPSTDHIQSSKAVIESVNKEMIHYHLQGYNLQINIVRAKGAKLSSAADALGAFVGENVTGGGAGSEFGGSAGTPHEWPDFNLKDFPVMSDEKGRYTNEPILLGIANHLQINGSDGISDVIGGGAEGAFGGQCPFTLDQFLNIDCSKFQKYAAGGYLHGDHLRKAIKARTFSMSGVPTDFLEKAKAYSSSSGCPLSILIIFGRSESRFTDHVPNSDGFGGYFGTHPKYGGGYGKPFDVQASFVLKSWNNAKKYSPGASGIETLVIAAISHQLPLVASKWWSQTNGKIWSLDADWLATNIKACWPSIPAVTLAEALEVNVVGQYYGCQAANGKIAT